LGDCLTMAITFPTSPADGATYTNPTTGVQYIYNTADGVWKTNVWPTNTNYLQLSGGTLTGALTTTGLTVSNSVALPNDSITAAELGTKTFVSYAVICDQKAYNVNGGTFTEGGWRTRDLNTEITDVDGIVSISSNQFTLGAGNYLIKWSAPGYAVGKHVSVLQNITETTTDSTGTAEYADNTYFIQNRSIGSVRVSLTGSTAYEIQHHCNVASYGTQGFGVSHDISGYNSIYTIVEIYKEA